VRPRGWSSVRRCAGRGHAGCAGSPTDIRSLIPSHPAPRYGPLLQMELDEEQRVVKERLLSWPLSRLQSEVRARAACGPCPHLLLLLLTKELVPQACTHARTYVYVHTHEYACTQTQGMVLVEMGGKKQGAYFGKTVLVFSLARGGDLPFHKFRCVQVRV